jgi:hypothetical protein
MNISLPKIKQTLSFVVATVALVFALARPAQATTISNPDLTVYGSTVVWDGVSNFSSTCLACFFSWTTPSGSFGGISSGDFQLGWNGSSGNFFVNDFLGLSGISGPLLVGTVTSFSANVANPGPGAVFGGTLAFTTTNLGFGSTGSYNFSSFDFTGRSGSADTDIAAIPEPTTLSLLGLGGAILAARRRRARESRTH